MNALKGRLWISPGNNGRPVGAIAVLFAVLLPLLLILVSFSINLAWIQLCRTQAFIAADAATRAAGRTYALSGSVADAKKMAGEAASKNFIAGKKTSIIDSEFVLGTATRTKAGVRYSFSPGGSDTNALKVSLKRLESSEDGSIPFIFPSFLGKTYHEISRSAVSTRVDVDIAFVVDRSGSMAYAANEKAVYPPIPKAAPTGWFFSGPAPNPSRWRDLAGAADLFLSEMTKSVISEQVSLVTYGDAAFTDTVMTSSYSSITSGIKKYTDNLPSAATNIGDGLDKGIISLGSGSARAFASKVVVLMTDGIGTTGPDPIPIATKAASDGIVIFTVTFADEADQTAMKKVAAAGNGQHFHANDAASLTLVLQTIIRILPTVLTE